MNWQGSFYFLEEGAAVSCTAVNTKHKEFPIPEGGLERSCLRNLYPCKEVLDKTKGFVDNQLSRKVQDDEKKLKRVMNLQNNNLTNSRTKRVV